MKVLHACCCGLDVHKQSVTACLLTAGVNQERSRLTRTFGTTTAELLELVDWLVQSNCTIAAIGLYRIILEARLQLARSRLGSLGHQCSTHQNRPWTSYRCQRC